MVEKTYEFKEEICFQFILSRVWPTSYIYSVLVVLALTNVVIIFITSGHTDS